MKKIASAIATVLLCCSFAGTALADQVQTVSVEVPPEPTYTATIPTNCSIEYGNTGIQSIGTLYVSSLDWDRYAEACQVIEIGFTRGQLVNENGHVIECDAGHILECSDGDGGPVEYELASSGFTIYQDLSQEYGIQVRDWSAAQPGTTYTLQITYSFSVVSAPNAG